MNYCGKALFPAAAWTTSSRSSTAFPTAFRPRHARFAAPRVRAPPAPRPPAGPPPGLDASQLRIWDLLAGGIRSADELAQHLGLAVPLLSTALMMLEMKKVVRRLPGNRYERC